MGDLNAISSYSEKEGGSDKSQASTDAFIEFMNKGGLMDLGFMGNNFT